MTQFIPDGFVSIDDAAETAASHWFKDDWKDVSHQEAREIEKRKLRKRLRQRRKAGELLSEQDERDLKGDDNPNLLLILKTQLRTNAWSKLRQSLFAGRLPFFVHTEIWGTLAGEDPSVWGSRKTAQPTDEITARCWVDDRRIEFVTGVPLVLATELSALVNGEPISPDVLSDLHVGHRTSGIKPKPEERESSRGLEVSAPLNGDRGKAPGGAPLKYDQLEFLLEAFFLLYDVGIQPKTQADLRREALLAYSATFDPDAETPSDEWAKPIIRRLWHRLGLGG